MNPKVMKKCAHCREVKSIDDYGKNKLKKDGYCGTCKDCSNELANIIVLINIKLQRIYYNKASTFSA